MSESSGPRPSSDPSGPSSPSEGPTPGDRPSSTRARLAQVRSSAFRRERAKRRDARASVIVAIVSMTILAIATYEIVTTGPPSSSTYQPPGLAPTIFVDLGTPALSTVPCGDGGMAFVERIPWVGSSQPVTTAEVRMVVFEIVDGDFIGDPGAVPNATLTDLCAGAPPSASALWYAVLIQPNATAVLTYADAPGWASTPLGPSNVGIQNGSTLALVTQRSLAGSGRGLEVLGVQNGSPIQGSVPL